MSTRHEELIEEGKHLADLTLAEGVAEGRYRIVSTPEGPHIFKGINFRGADKPASRIGKEITELMQSMPQHGDPAHERDAWIARKIALLAAIEEATT